MRLLLAIFVGFTISPTPVRAEVVTLSSLRDKALEDHPDLAAEAARRVQAEAQIASAQTGQKPRIEGVAELTGAPGGQLVTIPEDLAGGPPLQVSGARAFNDTTFAEALAPNARYSARIQLDWNLYDFGRTAARVRAARAEARARRADEAATAAELLDAIDQAYLDWLTAYEQARLQQAATQRLDERLERLTARRDAGAAADSELWPAKTALAAQRIRTARAEEGLLQARLTLEEATQTRLDDDAEPDRTLLELGTEPDDETAPSTKEAEALAARASAARTQARVHERRHAPRLSAGADVGIRGQIDSIFPAYRGTVGLTFPLWDGGQEVNRARERHAEAEALEAQLERVQTAAERRSQRNRLALREARRRVGLAGEYAETAAARLADVASREDASPAWQDELQRAEETRDDAALQLLVARVDRAYAALRLGSAPR